jgi:glycerol-3-phosphate dehydrogenase
VRTKNLRLHGFGPWRPTSTLEAHLYNRYGQDSITLLAMIKDNPLLGHETFAGQSYVDAEFVYAARHEMATSLIDLVARRTRAHLHDARATLASADAVTALVATEMGWSDEECRSQIDAYRELANREFTAAGLTL